MGWWLAIRCSRCATGSFKSFVIVPSNWGRENGFSISALALAGYFWAGDWFELWMAFVDGGGLMLGGLWMRRS